MQGAQGYQIWHSHVSWRSQRSWGYLLISLHISSFLYISLHFSAFLCFSLNFSAFHWISLHLSKLLCISLNFSAFLYISLHSSTYLYISLHLLCISLYFFAFVCIYPTWEKFQHFPVCFSGSLPYVCSLTKGEKPDSIRFHWDQHRIE